MLTDSLHIHEANGSFLKPVLPCSDRNALNWIEISVRFSCFAWTIEGEQFS